MIEIIFPILFKLISNKFLTTLFKKSFKANHYAQKPGQWVLFYLLRLLLPFIISYPFKQYSDEYVTVMLGHKL